MNCAACNGDLASPMSPPILSPRMSFVRASARRIGSPQAFMYSAIKARWPKCDGTAATIFVACGLDFAACLKIWYKVASLGWPICLAGLEGLSDTQNAVCFTATID